jgi:hypothetical protein
MNKPLQDASFYVHTSGWETVWEDPENPRFIVVRNGDMKIHARLKGEAEDSPTIIRYTTDLISYGIKTDEDIDARLTSNESWFWDNNPWFEVWDSLDNTDEGEVFFTLDEAITYAKERKI